MFKSSCFRLEISDYYHQPCLKRVAVYGLRVRRGSVEEEGVGRVAVTGALVAGSVPTRAADTGTQVLLTSSTSHFYSIVDPDPP